jgi:hypothetical protein
MIGEIYAVERLNVDIIALQCPLLWSQESADREIVKQHHDECMLRRQIHVERSQQRVQTSDAIVVAARIFILMFGIILLMAMHIVGVDVLSQTYAVDGVVVMRHDGDSQHNDADHQHKYHFHFVVSHHNHLILAKIQKKYQFPKIRQTIISVSLRDKCKVESVKCKVVIHKKVICDQRAKPEGEKHKEEKRSGVVEEAYEKLKNMDVKKADPFKRGEAECVFRF